MTSKTILLVCLTLIIMGSFLTAPVLASIDGTMYFDTLTGTQLLKRSTDYSVPQPKCKCAFANAVFGNDNTDTTKVHGTISFHQNPCGQTTFLGQFASGFNPKHKYSFTIRDSDQNTIVDLTPYFKQKILDNGSINTFSATTRQFSINCPQATNPQDLQGYDPDSSGGGYDFGQTGYGGGFGNDAINAPGVGGANVSPAVMGLGLFIYDNEDSLDIADSPIAPSNYNTR